MNKSAESCGSIPEERTQIREICALLNHSPELTAFLGRLTNLETNLASHFDREESPGELGDAVTNNSVRLERLFKQHPVILEALRELEGRLQDAVNRTQKVLEMVLNHTEEGEELMADALNDDLGGGD